MTKEATGTWGVGGSQAWGPGQRSPQRGPSRLWELRCSCFVHEQFPGVCGQALGWVLDISSTLTLKINSLPCGAYVLVWMQRITSV